MYQHYDIDLDFIMAAERKANAMRAQVIASGVRAAASWVGALPGRCALVLRRAAHI